MALSADLAQRIGDPRVGLDFLDSTNVLLDPACLSNEQFTVLEQNNGDILSTTTGVPYWVSGVGLNFTWNYVPQGMIDDIVKNEYALSDLMRSEKFAKQIDIKMTGKHTHLLSSELVTAHAAGLQDYADSSKRLLAYEQSAARLIRFTTRVHTNYVPTLFEKRQCAFCYRPCPLQIFTIFDTIQLCHKCVWTYMNPPNKHPTVLYPVPSVTTFVSHLDRYNLLR